MILEITKEQVEALLRYLITRPFVEVHEGVNLLRNLKPAGSQYETTMKIVPDTSDSKIE